MDGKNQETTTAIRLIGTSYKLTDYNISILTLPLPPE
jgi:hypothetical protein